MTSLPLKKNEVKFPFIYQQQKIMYNIKKKKCFLPLFSQQQNIMYKKKKRKKRVSISLTLFVLQVLRLRRHSTLPYDTSRACIRRSRDSVTSFLRIRWAASVVALWLDLEEQFPRITPTKPARAFVHSVPHKTQDAVRFLLLLYGML